MNGKLMKLVLIALAFYGAGYAPVLVFDSPWIALWMITLLMMAFAISCRVIAEYAHGRYYSPIIFIGFVIMTVSAGAYTEMLIEESRLVVHLVLSFVVFMTIAGTASLAFWLTHCWLLDREDEDSW